MYIYQNNNLCPCCGHELQDMSERELYLFSLLLASHNIEPMSEFELIEGPDPIDFPPPDAGLNPPVKPKI